MIENFAVFILTHGRPNNVKTYETLKKQGYTGLIYIIVDNEDKAQDEYKKRFGDKVIIFDKADISERFDTGDNFNDRRAVFYARNACFDIARGLRLDYFLQLDDDYTGFWYKFSSNLMFRDRKSKNLDAVFSLVFEFLHKSGSSSIALGQGGDLLGGGRGGELKKIYLKRKAMNTFFCKTDRPFYFYGRVNEDVNTYVTLGNRGCVFFTTFLATIIQKSTQSSGGGMTDLYLSEGTYRKSFYTVMYAPSCTKIYEMGQTHKRLHHKIKWENAVPCILDPKYKKTNLIE